MVFLFHSWYVMLGFVQNMKIFCSEYVFWFKFIEAGIFFTETSDYFFENYMVIQTLLTNLTLLYNICWMVCSPTVTYMYDWFPVILNDWYHMWGRKCSRNTWFHSRWRVDDFTHSLYIHCIICQSKDYVYGIMTLIWFHGLVWLI